MTKPIWQWTAVETARAVRSRQVSALDVTEAHIERLRAANPAINAVVFDLTEEALEAARRADEATARGEEPGALHGVPITIKENVDVKGWPNPNGVPGLASTIAPDDAPLVRNLRGAGAIILGLTNTPEFSMRAFTDNPLHGPTHNPWNAGITCGGSSGGAAAAIAAGIGTIAHGNDIGGSLRWPAHCCGVATIKPTQGRIPAFNPSAAVERPMLASLMSAQGPIARSVADVRLALEVMSRRDPRDPWWVPAPLRGPEPPKPIKVALARIPADMEVAPHVREALRRAADWLDDAGYAVEEAELPDLNGVWRTWADVLSTEMELMQGETMRALGSDAYIRAAEGFRRIANQHGHLDFLHAITRRSTHIRNWMLFLEDHPVILAPTTVRATPAPDADLGGDDAVRDIFWNDLRFISTINLLGLPGAVVPVGLHEGAPVGVQLIAGRYREDLALDAAEAIERRAGMLVERLWARNAQTH